MYAIFEDSGTQIKASAGDVFDLDLRPLSGEPKGQKVTFDKVLVVGDDDSDKAATIGKPYIAGATVEAEVVEQIRGEKLDIYMYKRRKGQHRKMGHRQGLLRVKITGING